MLFMIATGSGPFFTVGTNSEASAWTDGNAGSEVYPNYGIQDMIADKAYYLFNEEYPEKAEFIRYWYLWDGADPDKPSYDERHEIPQPDDNFLAWTDDGYEGDYVNYFINNGKGWPPIIDSPSWVQTLANRTRDNLTEWMMRGCPEVDVFKHQAAYNAGLMSKYVGDMSQFGHTDYSKWDQVAPPLYDPYSTTYQQYYESKVWTDETMTALKEDFWNRSFSVPATPDASAIHEATADLARWVNGRGLSPVAMQDWDGKTITVGANYKVMLEDFMYCWDWGTTEAGVRGFNGTLWNLTIENLIASSENLSAMYSAIYDAALSDFLAEAPDLEITGWSVAPDPVIANDSIVISASVKNVGASATRNTFNVQLMGPPPYNNWRPLQLETGQEGTVKFLAFKVGDAPFNFTITADHMGEVAESDEADNVLIGGIDPIPEVHSSSLELAAPFDKIRQDTVKGLSVDLKNKGNRYDIFTIDASTDIGSLYLVPPSLPVGVLPNSNETVVVTVATTDDTPMGAGTITISAVGANSTVEIEITVEVMERTKDPVPSINGPSWARLDELFTLSAASSSDPDGDPLDFLWVVPIWGNFTGEQITINYTKEGRYNIVLFVDDGNSTVSLLWPVTIYPKVPVNVSARVQEAGVSGFTVEWAPWRAGGLIAVWLEAEALSGQGALSERGPYITRVGPGNTSGRVGKFLPGTEVEVRVTVEAERYGNVTTDILSAKTSSIDAFSSGLVLSIEDNYLYLQYKPWVDPEGEREPLIVVKRWYNGFIPFDTTPEEIQKTKVKDTIRYPVGSNTGRYKATLTYYWVGEAIHPFYVENATERTNLVPHINVTGIDQRLELNVNGTCRVWFVVAMTDPDETVNLTIEWGDGSTESMVIIIGPESKYQSIFHNYSSIGEYDLRIRVEDWSGAVSYSNHTLQVFEYRPTDRDDSTASIIIRIVVAVVVGILLIIVLAILGYAGYKFSKQETKVEFDLKDMKSDMGKKPGTGTDFDERRELQIPKESIMKAPTTPKEEEAPPQGAVPPIIQGKVVFDEE